MAYKIKLPAHAKVHHVFHVTLLKKHIGSAPISVGTIPEVNQDDISPLIPLKVLQRREVTRDNKMVSQWLIHWSVLDTIEASWEDVSFIRNQFP